MTAQEELARLNSEILTAEKRAIVLAIIGRWTPEEDAKLSALYECRREWLTKRVGKQPVEQ